VKQAWQQERIGSNALQSTWASLSHIAGSLKNWSRDSFGSVRRQIQQFEKKLRMLREAPVSADGLAKEKEIEQSMCELFEREEIMAHQRSRVEWLREGDRNTDFFHVKASARKKTNRIDVLVRDDGSKCEDQDGIKQLVHTFYERLFSSEPSVSMDEVLEAIPTKVDSQMNESLCVGYSNEEIRAALFQMGPTKSPGPDGFPARFDVLSDSRDLIQQEVCDAVRGFLGGEDIPEGFCDSVIVLISKVSRAKHLSKLRPISLCNVLYKLAAKVLANRLKNLLPDIISEYQSAFVPDRLITDSAFIAYECLDTVRKQRNNSPFFVLKIDMMKAYDRIECEYLHGCLSGLGFADIWISSVMRCVTTARYAVKVNGELTSPVVPSRGIRQGDPISPYLFLLCMEGLSCLLQKMEDLGVLQGLRNGKQGPPISHLLFADDSIVFACSDDRSVSTLKEVLNKYCDASGQRINLQKYYVFFGHKCVDPIKQRVKASLEVGNEVLQDSYLGMPTEVARAASASFKFLPDRVWRSVTG
jgi:hypothetical protein